MTVMTHESFADTPIRQGIAPLVLRRPDSGLQ